MSIMIVLPKRRQTLDWFLDRSPLAFCLYRLWLVRPVNRDIAQGAGADLGSGALLLLAFIMATAPYSYK